MSGISRGKLKLKKPLIPSETSKSKVKKKDRKEKDKKRKEHKQKETKPLNEEQKTEYEEVVPGFDPALAAMTPAERAYELAQRERRRKRLEKSAELSHEDKLLRFNTYLSKLSDHYDIPKVGPG